MSDITDQLAQALGRSTDRLEWAIHFLSSNGDIDKMPWHTAAEWLQDARKQVERNKALSAYRASKEGKKWQHETAQRLADNYKAASESGNLPEVP